METNPHNYEKLMTDLRHFGTGTSGIFESHTITLNGFEGGIVLVMTFRIVKYSGLAPHPTDTVTTRSEVVKSRTEALRISLKCMDKWVEQQSTHAVYTEGPRT